MNKKKTSSESPAAWFTGLLDEMKSSGAYAIEQAKISIAEVIYEEMERQSLTKSELAKRLGSSRAYVTKILSGDVNFTIETLAKIGVAMNCESVFNLSFSPMNSPRQRKIFMIAGRSQFKPILLPSVTFIKPRSDSETGVSRKTARQKSSQKR